MSKSIVLAFVALALLLLAFFLWNTRGGQARALSPQVAELASTAESEPDVPLQAQFETAKDAAIESELQPGIEAASPTTLPALAVPKAERTPLADPSVERRASSGCTLNGTIRDERGDPVSGQVISLVYRSVNKRTYLQPIVANLVTNRKSDADGRFRFEALAPGLYWIGPSAGGDATKEAGPARVAPVAELIDIENGAVEKTIDLRVQRGLYIRGRTVSAANEPVANVYIIASNASYLWGPAASSDESGEFRLGPLTAEPWSLNVLGTRGYNCADSIETHGGAEGVIVRLEKGGSVSGKVVDHATKEAAACWLTLAGQDDRAMRWELNVGIDGRFEFDRPSPGSYALWARTSDGRAALVRGVGVSTGTATKDVLVRLTPAAKVRLRHEGPQKSCEVSVIHDSVYVVVDEWKHGNVREWIVPAGTNIVRVRAENAEKWRASTVEIAAGESKEVVVQDP